MSDDNEEPQQYLRTKGAEQSEQILEFRKTFENEDYLQQLCSKALNGKLRNSNIRSVAWKIFLGSCEKQNWSKIQSYRDEYEQLIQKHTLDPHKIEVEDVNVVNPLSQSKSNPWTQFFANTELEKLIHQDLIRLYPEYNFFRQENIQQYMQRILFIWARENSDTSYRQGMHELLAPFILVLCRDAKERKGDEPIAMLTDEKFIEHDAYQLFSRLMRRMKEYFLVVQSKPMKKKPSKDEQEEDPSQKTPIFMICHRIQSTLLHYKDPELCNYLKNVGVEPQIYGLRWIRLLFGREFHFEDVLVIWDAIFADSGAFDPDQFELSLVEHIAITMLIYIRGQLIDNDYSSVLRRLMKYPPVENPHSFVEKALESRKHPYQKFQINSPVAEVINHPLAPVTEKKSPTIRPIGMATPKQQHNALPNLSSISSHLPNLPNPLAGLLGNDNSKPSQPKQEKKSTQKPKTPVQAPPRISLETQLIEKEVKLSGAMETIIEVLTNVAFPKEGEQFDQDSLLMSIAELKHIRDVLKFQLQYEDRKMDWIKTPPPTSNGEHDTHESHPLQ